MSGSIEAACEDCMSFGHEQSICAKCVNAEAKFGVVKPNFLRKASGGWICRCGFENGAAVLVCYDCGLPKPEPAARAAFIPPEDVFAPIPKLKDEKPTNPKDQIAVSKLPLHLVPATLNAFAALAFAEGAAKYGAYNWRVSGVRASVYLSALMRHLAKWQNGEETDPITGVPHLASILACVGIILDARLCGKLTDDRPPSAPIAIQIEDSEAKVASLLKLFADRNPRHFTIADSEK